MDDEWTEAWSGEYRDEAGRLRRSPGKPLSEVQGDWVEWVWAGRIPRKSITILDGDPGLGKTLLALDLAARWTTGREMPHLPEGMWNDEGWGGNSVVYFSAEDDFGEVIRPRFLAAGGDPSRFLAVSTIAEPTAEGGMRERLPSFRDLDLIERTMERMDAPLVIFDPFAAYMDAGINSWRDQDVRAVLAPLTRLARRQYSAILILRHLNKSAGANPLYRGGGSIGIIGQARSGLVVAKAPENPEHERILVSTKSNLGRPVPALRYRIVSPEDPAPPDPADTTTWRTGEQWGRDFAPRIEWLGPCAHTAESVLTRPEGDQDPTATEEAVEFLKMNLRAGAQPATAMLQQGREVGIGPAALQRARARLGIHPEREGFGPGSQVLWRLPAAAHVPPVNAVAQDSPPPEPEQP